MSDVDKRRGWSKERWDQWYAEQRKKRVTAKSVDHDQGWAPSTLDDAVNVTTGSRLVAHQLAEQMRRDHPALSFQECLFRTYSRFPALYESEVAASQHVQAAHYGGKPVT